VEGTLFLQNMQKPAKTKIEASTISAFGLLLSSSETKMTFLNLWTKKRRISITLSRRHGADSTYFTKKKSFISKRGCLISHLSNILKLRNDDDDDC
jgi:phosphoribosyl-AMP cyclohydrolase